MAVLIGATFIVYLLLAYALDPLEDLRTSSAPNKALLIESRTQLLDLDTPPAIRWVKWLGGIAGCAVGRCDLGSSWRTGEPVSAMLGSAIPATVQLVGAATILAVALGITVGVASALRQYSGFDYGVTVLAFVVYSLPSFWVAVLFKLWGAIGFNDFLRDPRLSPATIIALALAAGALWQVVVGGEWRRRLVVFGASAAATAGVLGVVSATRWLLDPGLGPVGIGVLGAGAAVALTALSTGLRDRRTLVAALVVVAIGIAAYHPLQFAFAHATALLVGALAVVALVVGAAVGRVVGGLDRAPAVRTAALTGLVVAGLLVADRLMAAWGAYSSSPFVGGRPIATIGARTPGLRGDFWIQSVDTFTHLVLPTTVLVLVSFASYTRYSRASLLEELNQDYVRTARAKGLPERVVVVRHAFRNALIPLATLVPLDIAYLFGGAIITERIFGWNGMGALFLRALDARDADPIMGYFIVVGALLILANVVVDLLYSVLDPRIRVNA